MFSFVYLAGIVAAIYQLVTGSSRKAFPRLLNGWLSIRKHLGLIALWMTIQHIIVSCFLAVPGNFIDVGLKGVSTSMNRLVSYVNNDSLSLIHTSRIIFEFIKLTFSSLNDSHTDGVKVVYFWA